MKTCGDDMAMTFLLFSLWLMVVIMMPTKKDVREITETACKPQVEQTQEKKE